MIGVGEFVIENAGVTTTKRQAVSGLSAEPDFKPASIDLSEINGL